MRAQKIREEVAEKERDEHFNDIRLVIPTKQEWRVKEKANTPAPTTSDDDMNLLDDDEAPLIKDESLPSTSMDINMVFTLLADLGVPRRRLLRCVSTQKRSCLRSMKSQGST
jgi:hypothetical protein